MKITITGRQTEVPKDFAELVDKKLTKYDKFFRDDATAYVTLKKRRNFEILELTISSQGLMFRAEEENSSFQNALDEALASIERQLRKNKTKLGRRIRESAFKKEDNSVELPEEELQVEAEAPVRIKEFSLKPMSIDEAILEMNMLGHQFFVFEYDKTGEISVVYGRKDGGYGLICPKH